MRSWKGCEPRETVSAQARKTGPAGKGGRFFIGRSYEREMVAEPVGRARAASGPVAGGAHRGLDGSEEEGVTLRGKGSAAWAALLFLRPFRGTKKARAGRASAPDEAEDEAEAEEDGEAAGAGGFAFAFGGLRVSGRWISALRMVRALGFGLCGGAFAFASGSSCTRRPPHRGQRSHCLRMRWPQQGHSVIWRLTGLSRRVCHERPVPGMPRVARVSPFARILTVAPRRPMETLETPFSTD